MPLGTELGTQEKGVGERHFNYYLSVILEFASCECATYMKIIDYTFKISQSHNTLK